MNLVKIPLNKNSALFETATAHVQQNICCTPANKNTFNHSTANDALHSDELFAFSFNTIHQPKNFFMKSTSTTVSKRKQPVNPNKTMLPVFYGMRKIAFGCLIAMLCVMMSSRSNAQYVTQGVCTNSGNVFTLNGISQTPYAGRFWNTTKINLNNNFDLNFEVYAGNTFNNGFAFVLLPGVQPTASYPATVINTDNIHNFGTGSIPNDFVIEFDIRGSFCAAGQNTSYEPLTDINHIAYWKNNSACTFGNYTSPYTALGTIDYYSYVPYRIKWNKATNTLETYYNNVFVKGDVVDLVGILGTEVYWGFSAGCYCVTGAPAIKVIDPLPEINVQGNNVSINDGDLTPSVTDNTDFGSVLFGTNVVKTFTVQNTAISAALVIPSGGITVTGTDASLFTIGGIVLPATIPAGTSKTFAVTFAPSTTGLKSAALHIASNDADESSYDFSIQGTGSDTYAYSGSGSWTNAASWSPSYPGLSIAAGYSVSVSGDITIPVATTITNDGTLTIPNGATLTNSGVLINNGTLSKTGTFTNTGIYKGNGSFTGGLFTNPAAGTVSPGLSPGCQNYGAGFTTAGTLNIEVAGATPCTDHDKILVTGTATLGGTLALSISFTPIVTTTLTIIDATNPLTTTFATVTGLAPGWTVNYNNPAGNVELIYTVACTPTVHIVGGGDYCTIQAAVDAAVSNDIINVDAGTYVEDVVVNKQLTLQGAGYATTTVSGAIGGGSSTFQVSANGVIISGFTITRQGNNVTDWNGALNTAGVAIQSAGNAEVKNCKFIGNRTGIDINNSTGNNIHNNIITDNRTGLLFRNTTDNTTLAENEITNNWTAGVLFIDGSGGTNSPAQTNNGSNFRYNNISGNWYGQVVDRQNGGSLPTPGNLVKKFKCNWYGTASPVTSTNNSTEPGYAAQIPVAYGGTATAPGGQPDILGPASANIVYQPFLNNGTDNDPGTIGFQPVPGSCVGCGAGGGLVTNTTTGELFCSIQSAIDDPATLNGHTLTVNAGTYTENIVVNKSLTILGPNANVDACTGSRFAEAIIIPATGTATTGTATTKIISVTADNVTIKGFTLNGDNPALSSAYQANGADIDVDMGISCEGTSTGNNISIENNIIKNVFQFGVALGTTGGAAKAGEVVHNKIDNVPYWAAVLCYDDYYANISNNCISNAWMGVQIDNFYQAKPGGASAIISTNFINTQTQAITGDATYTDVHGIRINNIYQNTSTWTVYNNHINNTTIGSDAGSTGLELWSVQSAVAVTVLGNEIDDFESGYYLWNCPTSSTVTISGSVSNCVNGVLATNKTSSYGGNNSNYILSNLTITNCTNGVKVFDDPAALPSQQTNVQVNITSGVTITGGTTGLLIENTRASLPNAGSVALSGQSGNYIKLINSAANVLATSASFGGQTGATATLAQNFAIEDKIVHKIDLSSLGFVSVKANADFVTANSFVSPNTVASIQRGIDAASNGYTLNVNAGTYPENAIVNKSLTLLGPNASIDPCSGTRVAEAIVVPATAAISSGEIFHVAASNVTIKGFTIDGDNTGITSGYSSTNGADIDAAEGVTIYETGINNLTVSNNIIQNLSYFGVTLYDYLVGAPSTGHVISNNKIQNLGTYDVSSGINLWGGGVLLSSNQYAAVTNNCMTNVRIGLQTDNFYAANPGAATFQVISNNSISARRRGIFHNLAYNTASPYTISGNTITGVANANETASWDGILLSSLNPTASTASSNIINGTAITAIPKTGISVWNCQAAPLISGGTISGVGLGINVNNFEGYPSTGSNAGNTLATIDGVTVTGATIAGIRVNDNPLNTNGATVTTEIKGNTNVSGSPVGILVAGSDATANVHDNSSTITGNTIGADADGGTVSLYRNSISSNGTGVRVKNSGKLTSATENFIKNNTADGISIESTAGVTGAINNNDLSGNTGFAIKNLSATVINATCDWYGITDPDAVSSKISGTVTFFPYLTNGTDNAPGTAGFQPVPGSCTGPDKFYVNDNSVTGDHYTTAIGNDANPGTAAAPFRTIGHAISIATAGDTIYVDAGTFAGSSGPDKQLTFLGSNATISPNTGSRVAESILTDAQAFRTITTSRVTIKGFKLTAVAGNPIDNYTTGAKVTLEKNLFDGSVGLFFANADTIDVIDNRFNDLDDNTNEGIQVAGNYNGSTGTYMDVHDNTWINGLATGMNLSNVKGIVYNNNFTSIAYYGILVANLCNLDIYQNVFSGITNPGLASPTFGSGVRFYTPAPGLITSVRNNYFTNNYIGVAVRNVGGDGSLAGTTIHVNNNSITGSTDANIKNQATQTLEATCNWYGTTDQSAIVSKISGPVTFSTWLTNGTDDAPATPGFQPVAGSCNGVLLCESPAAQAYTSPTQTGNQAHRGELGMEFIVNNPNGILIKQLGAFDDGGNGITGLQSGGVRVAIFNRTTQTIVPGLNIVISGLADGYSGNHRLKTLTTPVNLPAGDYVLVAKGYNAGERNGNIGNGGGPYPAGDDGGGAITFGNETSYGPDDPNGFNYPVIAGNYGTTHQYLAGTFVFTTSLPCASSNNANLSNLVLSQGTLAPPFAPVTTSYSTTVPNSTTSITVTPTAADPAATITVNNLAGTSGNPYGPIALAEGSNIITVKVTAQDGSTIKTYTVNVTRSSFCETPAAQAYTSATSTGNQAHRGELGMEFIVNNPGGILIKQLGAFDDGGNGITGLQPGGGVRVAIFNRTTHNMVPGLDVTIVGIGDAYTGNHQMKNITPVTLPPGDYVIVAKGYYSGERNGNSFVGGGPYPAGDNGGGAITFANETSYGPDDPNGFSYPLTEGDFGGNHIFLAGTFDFTSVIPCGGGSCESPAAQAYTSNTTLGNQAHRGELGMQFIVNNPNGIIVKQLGAFDDGGNGIAGLQPGGGVRVAIFNRTTQTIVPGLDATIIGNADHYTGNHRMKDIPPITLLPGDYVIVAKGFHIGERNGNSFNGGGPYPSGDNGGGSISFGNETSYGPDDPNGFNYPSVAGNFGNSPVFLAGSFIYTVTVNCPPLTARTSGTTVTTVPVKQPVKEPKQELMVMTKEMKIYPNPTNGQFTVQLNAVNADKVNIQVMNSYGRMVEQKTVGVVMKTGTTQVPFNLSNQPAGIYLVKVESADGIQTGKIVIGR